MALILPRGAACDPAKDFAYAEKLAGRGYFDLAALVYEDAIEAYPNVADRERVLVRIAELHGEHGDPRRSRYWLEKLLDESPTTPRRANIVLRMAQTYQTEGRYEAALQLLDACIEEAGDRATILEPALFERATCLVRLGRNHKAAKAIGTFVARFPGSDKVPAACVRLGEAALGAGDLDKAVASFMRAQDLAQDARVQAEALYGIGRARAARGDLVRAASAFSRLTAEHASSHYAPYGMLELADIHEKWRNPEEALTILRRIVRQFPNSDPAARALVKLGQALRKKVASGMMSPADLSEDEMFALAEADFDEKRYEDAAKRYVRYIKKHPRGRCADLAQFKTGRCHEALTQWPEAAESYEAVAQFYPGSPLEPEALFRAGKAHERAKRPAEMAHVFSRLYQSYPAFEKIDTVLLSLGDALFAAKRYGEAAEMYRALGNRFPRSAHYEDALYRLGHALLHSKNYPAAAETFQDFSRKFAYSPNAARAAYMAGESLVHATWFRQAESALTQYVERFPHDESVPRAYFQLGVIHEAWGDAQTARDHYSHVVKSAKTDPIAADALHRDAIILYQQRKLADARKAFARLVEKWPQKTLPLQTYEWLAQEFERGGESALAVRVCELIVQHYASKADAREAVERAYDRMAAIHSRSKEWTRARQAWEQMLAAFPRTARRIEAKLRIAECYNKMRQFDEAILTLREIERHATVERQAQAKHEIGRCFMMKGRPQKGVEHFREVISKFDSPVCADWVLKSGLALAKWYEDQGDQRRARRAYNHARRVVPNSHELLSLTEQAEEGYRRMGGK